MNRTELLLFDTTAGGHHGLFYQHLVRRWGDLDLPGELTLVVPRGFMDTHDALPRLIDRYPNAAIRTAFIDPPLAPRSPGAFQLARRDLAEGALLRQAIETHRPRRCVLMHVDSLQLSLARGLRFDFDTTMAGIYFRPAFEADDRVSRRPAARTWQKRILLKLAVRNPHLSTLLCLNPLVVPDLQARFPNIQVLALPDGVEAGGNGPSPAAIRTRWGIEEGRHVALLFGSLAERKGLYPLLEALPLLPATFQRPLALVFSGAVFAGERDRFIAAVNRARATTAVQIIVQEAFIPEDAVQASFHAADLVLAPYQNHEGSSNVLVRAALAGVPLIGPREGLMGVHIRNHRLGMDVDVTQPALIADALRHWMECDGVPGFDPIQAAAFAAANTDQAFADTILQALELHPRR